MKKKNFFKNLLKASIHRPSASSHFKAPVKNLKILILNTENLFLHLDLYYGQNLHQLDEEDWQKLHNRSTPLKPLFKLHQLGRHIQNLSPHLLILSEVGGKRSLEYFNQLFLGQSYHSLLIEGNSVRGIDLGYLLHKDLPFTFELRSHREKFLPLMPDQKFSRDVLELRLFRPGELRPWIIFLAVHLKSQLDFTGLDPKGKKRRLAEVDALIKIFLDLELEFAGLVPILLAGDFNGRASKDFFDPEFAPLYEKTKLEDVLELARRPNEQRITHFHFDPFGLIEKIQFDYLFLPPLLHPQLIPAETFVAPYPNLPLFPKNRDELYLFPSDHFPLLATLKVHS